MRILFAVFFIIFVASFFVVTPIFAIDKTEEITVSANVSSEGYLIHSANANFDSTKKWYEYKNPQFITTIINTGNIDFVPTGRIITKNWFGKQIDSVKVNTSGFPIKPGKTEQFENIILSVSKNHSIAKPQFALIGFGKYTATLTLNYGGSAPIVLDVYYWIIPWRIILYSVLAAIAIFVTIKVFKTRDQKAKVRNLKSPVIRHIPIRHGSLRSRHT